MSFGQLNPMKSTFGALNSAAMDIWSRPLIFLPRKSTRCWPRRMRRSAPGQGFPEWKQEKLNVCFSLDRLPPAVRSAPKRFDAAHSFPEAAYLRRHLDLRAAIRKGRIASAFEHYRTHRYAEGRVI